MMSYLINIDKMMNFFDCLKWGNRLSIKFILSFKHDDYTINNRKMVARVLNTGKGYRFTVSYFNRSGKFKMVSGPLTKAQFNYILKFYSTNNKDSLV